VPLGARFLTIGARGPHARIPPSGLCQAAAATSGVAANKLAAAGSALFLGGPVIRLFARIAAASSVAVVLVLSGTWPAAAGGALGLNSPTGEPLAWTAAGVVVFGGLAFLVRAVVRLRRKA
jgi:hypothetical protein